jgi:hypothetical protein
MSIKKHYILSMESYSRTFATDLFHDQEIYAQWLAQTYFFVRHSTSLLGYALPYLKDDKLRHHFEHHLSEEERHDMLALKDLEKLGKNIKDYSEFVSTQAFYQSQYYRISFEGATSLLGYILFLEGLAVNWAKDSYLHIQETHKGSLLFLKVHAEEDPHHLDEAIKTIETLSASEQVSILRNLKYSQAMYEHMMQDIIASKKLLCAA